MIRIVYLGMLADLAGKGESEFASTSEEIDWTDLLALLENHMNRLLADAIRADTVKVALNGKVLLDREDLSAKHGDEIALLPPVSGG